MGVDRAAVVVPDSWDFSGSGPCLCRGGDYSQSLSHGPFCVGCGGAASAGGIVGCRLQERPPKAA